MVGVGYTDLLVLAEDLKELFAKRLMIIISLLLPLDIIYEATASSELVLFNSLPDGSQRKVFGKSHREVTPMPYMKCFQTIFYFYLVKG